MPTGYEPAGGPPATPAPVSPSIGSGTADSEPAAGDVGPVGWEPAPDGGPAGWEPKGTEIKPVESRGLALASLLLGVSALVLSFIFVVGVAAIVTGLVARARSRPRGAGGRMLARTGIALGAISLVLGAAIVAFAVHVDQTNRTFTSLRAGDCVDPVGGLLAHYTLTGCDKPHRYEAYGVVTALDPSGAPWPGDLGFGLDATQCTPLVLQYIDGPLDRARFQAVILLPSEADWDRGIRRIVCAVSSSTSKRLVGTVRGSGAGGTSGGST